MLHEEERKEKELFRDFISTERWVSFISNDSHNITDNFIHNITRNNI